ncbi:MAG: DNA-binding protein [Tissierellia bacterium]|nr:DNA-binding protein [Tissierellia bacterium]
MINRLVKINILFDFYGKLLSDRQYIAIELYYMHDLSLSEIGEELNISRQGVYDTLKRAENKLFEYEDILGLVNKFKHNIDEIEKIYQITDEIEEEGQRMENRKILEEVKRLRIVLGEIMDDSQEGGY